MSSLFSSFMSGGTPATNKPASSSANPVGNDDDNLPQVAIPAAKSGELYYYLCSVLYELTKKSNDQIHQNRFF